MYEGTVEIEIGNNSSPLRLRILRILENRAGDLGVGVKKIVAEDRFFFVGIGSVTGWMSLELKLGLISCR